MLLKKNLLLIACLGIFNFLQAQQSQTQKEALLKKQWILERPVTGNNVVFTISKKGDNINVSPQKVEVPRVDNRPDTLSRGSRGGNNYNVSCKIIFKDGLGETFKRGSKITFPPNAFANGKTSITGTLNADGSYSFIGVPKGKCDLWLDDIKIVTGWMIGGE